MARSLFSLWTSFRNGVDFALRNVLRWSPPARERPEPKAGASAVEASWVGQYGLAGARERMTAGRWRRNLAVVEILDRVGREPEVADFLRGRSTLGVLDIGSKNFEYVDALAGFWSRHRGDRTVTLTGLEVDAYRRYTDLRTRKAWADHYCSQVPGARFLARGLEDHGEPCDVVTWFFPFVTEFPLLRWGLPLGLFRPQALFDHAWDLLAPGGLMVLVNLTGAEAEVQHGLVRARGAKFLDLGAVPGSFSDRARDQRLTLVLKPLTLHSA